MVYITPAMLLVALSTGAIWVVVPLGLVFLGGPMQIVWYLLQPQVKKATCAPDQTFSRVKFTSLFGLVTLGSLLFFIWLAMMTLQAIGRGIR
jgi:hypothetical protein